MSERGEGVPRLAMIKSSDNSCDDTQVQNQAVLSEDSEEAPPTAERSSDTFNLVKSHTRRGCRGGENLILCQENPSRTSPAVQRLRLQPSSAGGCGFDPWAGN